MIDFDFNDIEKVPHSVEAEQGLLGILLNENLEVIGDIQPLVKPSDFFNPIHERIANLIWTLSRRGQKSDVVMVAGRFKRDDQLEEIGGVSYLRELFQGAPDQNRAEDYSRLIADFSVRRMVMKSALELFNDAGDLSPELIGEGILDKFEGAVHDAIGNAPATAKFISMRAASHMVIDAIETGVPMGVPTGYPKLDEKLGGFGREKLIILAGRPKQGKTCSAMNLARSIVKGIPVEGSDETVPGKVGFFSQEMPATEIAERHLSASNGTNAGPQYKEIARHDISDDTLLKLKALADASPESLLIDETGGLTVTEIINRARAMKRQMGGMDALFIDYLQMMSGRDHPGMNDNQLFGAISKKLKEFAKNELKAPIILLSQVNRKCEDRTDKRPFDFDLKGSGTIEDSADVIIMVYRHEHYLRQKGRPDEARASMEYDALLDKWENVMEWIIRKNKGGPEGTVKQRCYLGHDIVCELTRDQEDMDQTFEGF